jgi:hypothetical protein
MASDASSGDGRRTELERAAVPAQSRNDLQQRSTADLTQELAQLLAATIAQRQLTTGALPAPTAGGVNLSGLPPSQRMLEPTFRDGLSALSYKGPRGTNLMPAPELPPDDEPMPIPSTWREPVAPEGDKWLRQQMGATLLGLGAGLLVVVPAVLWLSGWLGTGQKTKPVRAAETSIAPIEPKAGDVQTVKVQVRPVERATQVATQYVTGSIDARTPTETVRPPVPAAEAPLIRAPEPAPRREPARARGEEDIVQAKQRIESGDIVGAREMLTAAEAIAPGPALFALAETYDPNMLAAWGTRGATADVARARALYHKSLNLGMTRAQARLDALQ